MRNWTSVAAALVAAAVGVAAGGIARPKASQQLFRLLLRHWMPQVLSWLFFGCTILLLCCFLMSYKAALRFC